MNSSQEAQPSGNESFTTSSETGQPQEESSLTTFAQQVNNRPKPEQVGDPSPFLECTEFSVYYDDFEAVQDVSLEIPRKEVTAIIGPSGCGKSTFLQSINRMTDLIEGCHTDGDMVLDGIDVYGEDVDVVNLRRRVGMVFQKPNPFPGSVYENVSYGPTLHGQKATSDIDQVVERTLKHSALWDEVKDQLHENAMELSGGQQQRLCIARAIAMDPDVVLLDEPTSALDPGATNQIENLITRLRGDYTVIIITHNMQQAARISDYTMFLYKGKLIEFNDTDQLFMNPQEETTADYITGRFG